MIMTETTTPPPKVLIECPHLVTVRLGDQFSCSMCGSVWGGSPLAGISLERIERELRYQEHKATHISIYRRIANLFKKRLPTPT